MIVTGAPHLSAPSIRTVAVIGAGPAGRGFAAACLLAGIDVVLEDVMPSNLRAAEADLLPGPGSLSLVTTVEDAVRNADLAIDFVPDELESKLEIFFMLDRMAPPRTILCSPTEALSITDLASCVYRPDRCMAVSGLTLAGISTQNISVQFLYPDAASLETRASVQQFFATLGIRGDLQPDPRAPMLTANQLNRSNII
jgi:3-hydroxybutyryl-CoA dehydrogenase